MEVRPSSSTCLDIKQEKCCAAFKPGRESEILDSEATSENIQSKTVLKDLENGQGIVIVAYATLNQMTFVS